MKNRIARSTISNIFYISTGIFLIFVISYLVSILRNDEILFPSISTVFVSFGNFFTNGKNVVALGWTLLRLFSAVFSSFILCFILTFVYILNKSSLNIIKPMVFIMKTAPIAAISIYLFFIIGSEIAPYFIVFMVVFPIMSQAFFSGIDQIDPAIIDDLKTIKGSFIVKFFKVYVPLIAPNITLSLLQSFGLGLKVCVMAEYLCISKNSLGNLLAQYKTNIEMDNIIVVILICVLVDAIFELSVAIYKHKVLKSYN